MCHYFSGDELPLVLKLREGSPRCWVASSRLPQLELVWLEQRQHGSARTRPLCCVRCCRRGGGNPGQQVSHLPLVLLPLFTTLNSKKQCQSSSSPEEEKDQGGLTMYPNTA